MVIRGIKNGTKNGVQRSEKRMRINAENGLFMRKIGLFMVNEKDFKETFGKLNHEQLLDLAFNLQKEVDILQENNSSLKRSLYGRKRENVSVDQLSLFNEAEVTDEISSEEETLHQKAKELEDKVLPSEKLYKAIQYTLNQWNALIYYLQDGRIPATNNIAEREEIKPFVMARKNF